MKRFLLQFVLFLFFIMFAGSANAITITLDSLGSTVNVSDAFTINVVGTDFPATAGGGINLSWDPAVITLNTVAIASPPWSSGAPFSDSGSIDNAAGTLTGLRVGAQDFINGVIGDFTVASLGFTADALGLTNLSLMQFTSWGGAGSGAGTTLDVTYTNDSVNVAAIPEPTSLLLVGSGLAGLIGFSRKRLK